MNVFLLFSFLLPTPIEFNNTSNDVNLIVVVSDCVTGNAIPKTRIEIPTAAIHAGSQSYSFTDDKGIARIYPLRFGNQSHILIAKADGYRDFHYQRLFKSWSSYEIEVCLSPLTHYQNITNEHQLLFAWSEKYPIPYATNLPIITDCQCVSYWSRSQLGSVVSIGVAGLSPDLMVTLDYFSKLPIKHGLWIKQDTPHEGDTIIIQPQAFMYRYSFTGHAYSEYYQLRPGHIGIVETVDEFVGEPIDLVGKHFDTFYGWHIRFRNANWPAAWMENNRYYPERVGHRKDEIVCKNVGVSDIIIPKEQPLITFWSKKNK